MHPILFKLGPFTIYSYGFFLALAFLTGSILAEREAKRNGIESCLISNLCLMCLISGIVGARLLFIILNFAYFRDNPEEIIMLQHGGLVWYGGLSLALVCGFVYLAAKEQAIFPLLDLTAPYVALAQSIGRIGCFLNGCCFGKLWEAQNILYPTQIFSSLFMLLVFLILRILQRRQLRTGGIFLLYLVFYSAKRFFMEFLRADSQLVVLNLTVFQVISVGILILASVFLLVQNLKRE